MRCAPNSPAANQAADRAGTDAESIGDLLHREKRRVGRFERNRRALLQFLIPGTSQQLREAFARLVETRPGRCIERRRECCGADPVRSTTAAFEQREKVVRYDRGRGR